MEDMPIPERRRIEAAILGQVYEVLKERHGEAEAKAVIGAAVSKSAIEQGKGFAEALGRAPDFTDFDALMALWTAEDALRVEKIALSEDRMAFNVTRCRYAEMYREMGHGEIGDLLSCNRDGGFCVGYNPEMELTRSQTIMQGADHCDFRYRMKGAG